jgi:hypothetical protein
LCPYSYGVIPDIHRFTSSFGNFAIKALQKSHSKEKQPQSYCKKSHEDHEIPPAGPFHGVFVVRSHPIFVGDLAIVFSGPHLPI